MFDTVEFAPGPASQVGVTPSFLRDLPQVILFAGKNGSGKTRYLRLLQQAHVTALRRFSLAIQRSKPPLRPMRVDMAAHTARIDAQIQQLERSVLRKEGSIFVPINTRDILKKDHATIANMPYPQFLKLRDLPLSFDVGSTFTNMLMHLTGMVIAVHQSKHPELLQTKGISDGVRRAHAFTGLLRKLFNTDLGYDIVDGAPRPSLFGRPFAPDELSPGQRILLAWALAIHSYSEGSSLVDNAVITIDEPEIHMHPGAYIDVLQRLYEGLIRGTQRQLWLATHSPSIISYFAPLGDLYFVENNSISRATNKMAVAIEGLLGGSEGRERLQTFLSDADEIQFAVFMAQCLSDAMVSGRAEDTQSNQFVRIASSKGQSGSVRVLDYGSGRGRFARALSELPEELRKTIDYSTYDAPGFDQGRPERVANVKALYPTEEAPAKRCSNEITDYANQKTVDLVVMANFLHEIPPAEWWLHFKNAHDVLSSEGALVVFEDQQIAVGELPTKIGYIVLELGELRTYLGTTDGVQKHDVTSDRCSVLVVSRSALASALARDEGARRDRLKGTLESVRERAIRQIREARASKGAGVAAHARAVVQLANVTLALTALG